MVKLVYNIIVNKNSRAKDSKWGCPLISYRGTIIRDVYPLCSVLRAQGFLFSLHTNKEEEI